MSDKRLYAALCKLDADNENERHSALGIVNRMLKERDVTWAKVAELVTGSSIERMTAPAGGPVADRRTEPPPPRPDPAPRPAERTRLSGKDIPARLEGKVRILAESADGMTVEMMGVDWWGPLLVRNETQRAAMTRAADRRDPRTVKVIVATVTRDDRYPEIIDVQIRFAGT